MAFDILFKEHGVEEDDIHQAFQKLQIQEDPEFKQIMIEANKKIQLATQQKENFGVED